jgi:hypothetical protein
MAFTKIASVDASSSNSGVSVVTAGIDTTGANLIVVHVADYTGGSGDGALTDSKGNTWTGLTAATLAAEVRSRLYYSLSGTVGSGHTFTYTTTSGTSFPSIQVIASAFDQQSANTNASANSIQPGSLTPPSNDALFVTGLGLGTDVGGTTGINSSFTFELSGDFVGGHAEGGYLAYLIQGTAGALNPTWSWTGLTKDVTTMATFTASVGGGSDVSAKIIFETAS